MGTYTRKTVAAYINDAQERLEDIIRSQFRRSTLFVILSITLFFLLYASMAFFFRSTTNDELLQQMEDSNNQLTQIAQALVQPGSGASSTKVIDAVVAQAELHRQALQDVRRSQQQIPSEGLSLIQLLGGSAVLALLGFLGLQRLQNIDTEIQTLREYMFRQIKERTHEGRRILTATIDDEVDKRFEKTQDEIQKLTEEFQKHTEHVTSQFVGTANTATQRMEQIEHNVNSLLKRYDWLESPQVRATADEISQLASTRQANAAAERFNLLGDKNSAQLALEQISRRKLPGDADDFHNACTEALNMQNPQLALEIVEQGLSFFDQQYDLMADKTIILTSIGKPQEAIDLVERWRKDKPSEFSRGWRPFVFYVDAVLAGELRPTSFEQLEEAFKHVTERLPHEVKVWNKYARVNMELGEVEKAKAILNQALEHNPLSQELNFTLGELLLQEGKAEEAVPYLQKSLSTDYQSQWQHGVNQLALRCLLAQAYEATSNFNYAELLYRSILVATDAHPTLKRYATNRLHAIALLKGNLPVTEESQSGVLSPKMLAEMLKSVASQQKGDSVDGKDLA